MQIPSRDFLKDCFNEYVADYNLSDAKIKAKKDHSLRVADLCERIAKDNNLSTFEIDFCYLFGLLHDIGRFEQVRRYNTFYDRDSVSHAAFGADLLFKSGEIKKYIADITTDEMILLDKIIRCHSDFIIPEDYGEKERYYASLLRDADKIDILRVVCEVDYEELYNIPEKQLRLEEFSPEVMEAFSADHKINRKLMKSHIDNLLVYFSFLFNLTFDNSKKIMKEQGFILKLLDFKTENKKMEEQLVRVRKIVENELNRLD